MRLMSRFLLLSLIGMFISGSINAQSFGNLIARSYSLSTEERIALVDSFMASVTSFPYIENDTTAHFIYRGSGSSVEMAGDATGWSPEGNSFSKLQSTDFWYLTRSYESDARLDYKIIVNGTWKLDPRNPVTMMGGFGPNSELSMPDYVPDPNIVYNADIPHGTLVDTTFFSTNLNGSRTIRVYLPPGYDTSSSSYPVVLVHDGLEYISICNTENVLDNLINQGRMQPIIGLFVPPVDRSLEYSGAKIDNFSTFIIEELFLWLDAKYRTKTTAKDRLVMGASNGGNISLYLAVNNPTFFGKVAAQSSNVISSISDKFQNSEIIDLDIYLDLGTYDIPMLIPMVRDLNELLTVKSYDFHYAEYHEGHSWGNWRARLDDIFEMFFPPAPTSIKEKELIPKEVELHQNYPNPFNPETTIEFTIPKRSNISISIHNLLGQRVNTIVNNSFSTGKHQTVWDGTDSEGQLTSSEVYIYRISVNGAPVNHKRMILLK